MTERTTKMPAWMREFVEGMGVSLDDVTAVIFSVDPAVATKAAAAGYHSEIAFSGSIEFLNHDPLMALAFVETEVNDA